MKRITEKYGEPCNYIELSDDEYKELYYFLLELGVELRPMIYHGDKKIYECQARNPFKDRLQYVDKKSYDSVTKDVKQGWWRR